MQTVRMRVFQAARVIGLSALALSPALSAQSSTPVSSGIVAPKETFADLTASLQPAVVNISAKQHIAHNAGDANGPVPPMEALLRSLGQGGGQAQPRPSEAVFLGSGFLISSDGYIVTNSHVLTGGEHGLATGATLEAVTATMQNGKEYTVKVVGRDDVADIAVLKLDTTTPLPFVRFGDSAKARPGDWVIAIGNPFALGGTVTAGIVSAIHRSIGRAGPYDHFIQTDASINEGNSGGPLFDMSGNVIGINNIIISSGGGGGGGGNVGVAFAIPADTAKPVVEALMHGGRVHRGFLGIGAQPVDEDMSTALGLPKNHGEIVIAVQPGMPGDRAGLKQGDVLLRVAGIDITPDETLSYAVSNQTIGARIDLDLLRDGVKRTVAATVVERPASLVAQATNSKSQSQKDDPSATVRIPELGATVTGPASPTNSSAESEGVVMSSVDNDSDLAVHGLHAGDVILAIDQRPAASTAIVRAAVAAATAARRSRVLMLVQRTGVPPVYVGISLVSGQPGN